MRGKQAAKSATRRTESEATATIDDLRRQLRNSEHRAQIAETDRDKWAEAHARETAQLRKERDDGVSAELITAIEQAKAARFERDQIGKELDRWRKDNGERATRIHAWLMAEHKLTGLEAMEMLGRIQGKDFALNTVTHKSLPARSKESLMVNTIQRARGERR